MEDEQDAVILQNDCLLLLESHCDRIALSGRNDDAAELGEQGTVVVKRARVLSSDLELFEVRLSDLLLVT